MPNYRAYLVNKSDHFCSVVPLDCEDDAAAMKEAELLVDCYDVELWQRNRMISLFLRIKR